MPEPLPESRRRYPRVSTPQGLWVSWNLQGRQTTSRVRDLNLGGLFVATPAPPPVGTRFGLLLAVQEGEIRTQGIVRNVSRAEGMGVEFVEMAQADSLRFRALVTRLLRSSKPGPPDSPASAGL